MRDDQGSDKRTAGRWIRIGVILALALLSWLSRTAPPRVSAAFELDPSYQQALGVALKDSLRFGREIVFTSGPLAYFTASPFDPDLYWVKLWLWDVLLGGFVAVLFFSRLVRRATWIDVVVGALILIVFPRPGDWWLFVMGLLAADLALETMGPAPRTLSPWLRILARWAALLVLSILTLVKVTSMTFAIAVLVILMLHAASSTGWRSALRLGADWTLVQCLVWLCIGQKLVDLLPYFWNSIELASGFDSAMSQPPTALSLYLCIACLAAGLALCVLHARRRASAADSTVFDTSRTQAVLVAVTLLLERNQEQRGAHRRAEEDPDVIGRA